jgi:hypothetical protein
MAYNAGMLTTLLLAGVLSAAAQHDTTKVLTQDLAGISTVVVDANVADVRLVTGAAAVLQAKVVLDSRDASRLPECAKSELHARREGATLRLTLSQSGRKHCHEAWSVEIPAGIAIDATVAVGSIDAALKGQYGDVDVHANVGKASLALNGHRLLTKRRHGPSESVRVDGKGARVTLRSNVGNVEAVVTTREDDRKD